jgi:hypothetical protein
MSVKIGLIVRCKEEPYILEFVDYYLKQGIDRIYILDDDSTYKTYNGLYKNEKVEIIPRPLNYVFNLKNQFIRCQELYTKIKNEYDWMVICDADEFISTKKNIDNTIRDELETTFKNTQCIKIPWIMMACNSIQKNPDSLLKTNVFRMDNNKHHPNKTRIPKFFDKYNATYVKSIFQTKYFNNIDMHVPLEPVGEVTFIESIYLKKCDNTLRYYNLREESIPNAYLLCYHYRVMSVENCINKIKHSLIYQQRKIKVEDMLLNDYPEIYEEAMKNKAIKLNIKDRLDL